MRLVVLNDNVPAEGLLNDWGWSVLVEGKHRFLFDADTRGEILLHNAEALGVSLKGLDFAVLSHWHYDHYGGFSTIAELNPGLELYAPPGGNIRGLNIAEMHEAGRIADGVWTSGALDGFEQAVGVETPSGLVVIVGCSHPGPDRLTEAVLEVSGYKRAHLVIGGFHYPSRAVLDRLAKMSEFIAPAHCSGEKAKAYVRREYPEKFVSVKTGSTIEL
ncbi:MBL fold metallo-hydrolase [Thermococcus gammatolerans]|uniref:Metal-dependent hydrolase/oxidoreductase, beta-lactamase family n=1 Tax=Thermococcus gammatolerans (strain DSM 15229 / JCM 11827 / EJ3) TaxID=593117 RepID=C5A761_THEGJ|nr:MBL fold metallo-hydrolase [Thermococcus gammatolerans]ACS34073.1 Metal-dependent hydrolase/oxidoreductase, beta-lactamase family [Thermococcus gammatolerans EJ3]